MMQRRVFFLALLSLLAACKHKRTLWPDGHSRGGVDRGEPADPPDRGEPSEPGEGEKE